ncbi:TetR family transcriptional regulator [Nostoc sp. 3335mG]|nr:TetR family transcriptional regulator [Nostoc sp. 3335mG]
MTRRIRLKAKLQPTQARAQDTYEVILATAGEMLRDQGFEQLTTNAICQRAGLTPPALYRYFPNKYAILKELGDRLMAAQDEEMRAWIEGGGLADATFGDRLASAVAIQKRMAEITRAFPGGAAIGRALRAVPMLQKLRFASRDMVAGELAHAVAPLYPRVDPARLGIAARMLVELSYSATEMMVEEPDRDTDALAEEVCRMFILYFDHLS